VLHDLAAAALLAYLAVAHYGRGRGDWAPSEAPAHWQPAVTSVLTNRRDIFARLWSLREEVPDAEAIAARLVDPVTDAARDVLRRLYRGVSA